MEYIKRFLRVLAVAFLSPLIVATFCVGMVSMPLTYGLICAYFYVKGVNEFNKEADYYTGVVIDFFMEDIWNWPTKYILKLK